MRVCPGHWRGVEGLWPHEGWGGDVERMSRQMVWDGRPTWTWGGAGGGMSLMGEGGMPLVCAQGWKESCSVIIP